MVQLNDLTRLKHACRSWTFTDGICQKLQWALGCAIGGRPTDHRVGFMADGKF